MPVGLRGGKVVSGGTLEGGGVAKGREEASEG